MKPVVYRVALQATDRTVGLRRTYRKAKRFAERRVAKVPVRLAITRIDLVANESEVVQHIEAPK